MEGAFVLVATFAVVSGLIARFYYGITPADAAYYIAMHTFVGQMLHDTALSKHKNTVHSKASMHDAGSFIVRTVAYLEDNYAYIIVDKETGRTAVVDPADPERVFEQLRELQNQWDASQDKKSATADSLGSDVERGNFRKGATTFMADVKARPELTTALITHYHMDHAGGNKTLRAKLPELRIIGSAQENVPCANTVATDGAKFWLGKTEINVIAAPCHTKGHILYHVHGPAAQKSRRVAPDEDSSTASPSAAERSFAGSGALFTGDTVFIGGVGKFFEGTAEQMYNIIYHRLRAIPAETPVFCGHEYTVDNLKFALWIEKGNRHVEDKLAWAMRRRSEGLSTVPSLLSEERQHNPFFRVHLNSVKSVIAATVQDSRGSDMPEIPALSALRKLKDQKAHQQASAPAQPTMETAHAAMFSGTAGNVDRDDMK